MDATFAPPSITRPLDYGVDLSLHSATKGLGGHNDATLGVVSGSADLIASLWGFAILQGANAAPFDAMNGLRGLRTLGVRLERQSATAQHLAEALSDHPGVESVRYPGLASHPQHDLAKRQMRMFGGLLAFDLAGGHEAGERFVEAVKLAQIATSLGGPETLVTHSGVHHPCRPDARGAEGRRHRTGHHPGVGGLRAQRRCGRRPPPRRRQSHRLGILLLCLKSSRSSTTAEPLRPWWVAPCRRCTPPTTGSSKEGPTPLR